MRYRLGFLALAILMAVGVIAADGGASEGPYFGAENFPAGCLPLDADKYPDLYFDDVAVDEDGEFIDSCYHMRTNLNALDSPQVDVLILVPVSPFAERDMRIMRQSIEMWEGGLNTMARRMGLDWLADGVDFHISVDYIDMDGGGGEFTTYPMFDPEIVVIASNPQGVIGIGIDPVDFASDETNTSPCHGLANPFDLDYWEDLPGWDSHHEGRSGTYEEDCGGSGGNICFAVNTANELIPGQVGNFYLFDLVAHEVGHCLTLGHVGDAGDHTTDAVPDAAIMAYADNPDEGIYKCVSSFDAEVFATRMSAYLDTNGDGVVDGSDKLDVNDPFGDRDPFHTLHPDRMSYASSTGAPGDCPQPNVGLESGPSPDWEPELVPAKG